MFGGGESGGTLCVEFLVCDESLEKRRVHERNAETLLFRWSCCGRLGLVASNQSALADHTGQHRLSDPLPSKRDDSATMILSLPLTASVETHACFPDEEVSAEGEILCHNCKLAVDVLLHRCARLRGVSLNDSLCRLPA